MLSDGIWRFRPALATCETGKSASVVLPAMEVPWRQVRIAMLHLHTSLHQATSESAEVPGKAWRPCVSPAPRPVLAARGRCLHRGPPRVAVVHTECI